MKKTHLILLIITAIMALFSAYSLAAINQVYNIDFEWLSQYKNSFTNGNRDTSFDKWLIDNYPKNMKFGVITDSSLVAAINNDNEDKLEAPLKKILSSQDYDKYVVIYCSLGETTSPEYRVKFVDLAQRGNVVEVKVSLNSPTKEEMESFQEEVGMGNVYRPVDVIRIHKETFSSKGGLYFIFKTQSGRQVFEKYYEIR